MGYYFGHTLWYSHGIIHKSQRAYSERAKKIVIVSLVYNANVAFALVSMKGVNISMYIAVRRLTSLVILIVGLFIGKRKPTIRLPARHLTAFHLVVYLPILFCICFHLSLFRCWLILLFCIFILPPNFLFLNIRSYTQAIAFWAKAVLC